MKYSTPRCINCHSEQFRRLYKKNDFNILKCCACGLVFTDIPDRYDLAKIYDHDYFTGKRPDGYADYRQSETVLRKEFSRAVALLRKRVNYRENLKLLEIGCAFGYFLDEASPYFECFGIEISAEAVKYAVDRGHRVYRGEVNEKILDAVGNVDIIVMFDVIEHLPNPVETFSLLSKILNSGGLFLVVTGDIGSLPARVMKKRWRLMTPPQHAFFFSKQTLTGLFRTFDLQILKIDRPWKLVPLGLVSHQLGRWLGLGVKGPGKRNNRGVYLNLFDTIRVIARK